MKMCPECSGQLSPIGQDFFCLDCDFDTLKPSRFHGAAKTKASGTPTRRRNTTPQWIEIDAEWYFKTQLRQYRKWRDRDFLHVSHDYIFEGNYRTTIYFHRSTVEAHETTSFFRDRPRRQTYVPDDERINELAYDLTVRGEDLMKAGWTYEMIDRLPQFVEHRWRRKRKFLLCDLSKVSKTFYVGEQIHETPRLGGRPPNPYRFL